MVDMIIMVLTALAFGFTWACVIVGLHHMFEISKMPEEDQRRIFDLHIRA